MTLGFQCVTRKMRRKFSKNTCLLRSRGPRVGPEALVGPAESQKVYLRTKNSLLRAFLFIVVTLLTVSCFDRGDCLYVNTTEVKVKVMDKVTRASAGTKVTFSSIHVPGVVILHENKELSFAYLLIDPGASETKFVFQYPTRSDTLVLGYTSQARVLSPECGTATFFDGLEVKYSTFAADNVVIKNPSLLTSVASNIEIYF
jgi:Family of unknown function (DUF6452)